MNRSEVIKIMLEIKKRKPNYFLNFSVQQKNELVDEWTDRLGKYSFPKVYEKVTQELNVHNRVLYPREIIDLLEDDNERNVYSIVKKYECPDGRIRYGESLYNELSFDDWYKIPTEMMSRMEYDPSLNTPEEQEMNNKLNIELSRKIAALEE